MCREDSLQHGWNVPQNPCKPVDKRVSLSFFKTKSDNRFELHGTAEGILCKVQERLPHKKSLRECARSSIKEASWRSGKVALHGKEAGGFAPGRKERRP